MAGNAKPQAGDKVRLVLEVRGKIVRRSDSHGLAYQVELEQRDFGEPRVVWVGEDEVLKAETVE